MNGLAYGLVRQVDNNQLPLSPLLVEVFLIEVVSTVPRSRRRLFRRRCLSHFSVRYFGSASKVIMAPAKHVTNVADVLAPIWSRSTFRPKRPFREEKDSGGLDSFSEGPEVEAGGNRVHERPRFEY